MKKKLLVTTNFEKFEKVIEDYTDKKAESSRIENIIRDYSSRYKIKDEVVSFRGKRLHVEYLPSLDTMLEVSDKYDHAKEVVGAAIYKIEMDQCLFMTDTRDQNLRKVYEEHKSNADQVAEKLWSLVSEKYPVQWTHLSAHLLTASFWSIFGESYKSWRESLANHAGE